jgi:hypothetical protein
MMCKGTAKDRPAFAPLCSISNTMSFRKAPLALFTVLAFSCAEPNMKDTPATAAQANSLSEGVTVMLKSAEGTFVACEIGLEGEDKATLVASRPQAGDWERFTMFTKDDGRIVLQAANGKYICADDYRAGLLVADRDKPGDWETFTIEPKDGGKVAIKTHNGSYVSADFGLEGARRGRLIGDRKEQKDWELFTIVPDTTVLP